jgi:hypothetical protein
MKGTREREVSDATSETGRAKEQGPALSLRRDGKKFLFRRPNLGESWFILNYSAAKGAGSLEGDRDLR